MRISSAHDGSLAVVRLAGRLDGASAEQLSETLDRLLREGQRSILLDMSKVSYLSSPGIHVLQRAHLEFSSLRRELQIGAASSPVQSALEHVDLPTKLVVPVEDNSTIWRLRATSSGRSIELTRDSWRSPTSRPSCGSYGVSLRNPNSALTCRLYGRAEGVMRGGVGAEETVLVEFPDSRAAPVTQVIRAA